MVERPGVILMVETPDTSPHLRLRDERDGQQSGGVAIPLDAAVQGELERLAARYDTLVGSYGPVDLRAVGEALYALLDAGPAQGWLAAVKGRSAGSCPFEVRSLNMRPGPVEWALLQAPWELLADGEGFWAQDARMGYAPARRLGPPSQVKTLPPLTDKRLGVVFMSASPRGVQELDFEAEETGILRAAGRLGMDLEVEDSGDPAVLSGRLTELGDYPVLHLSCHGHHAYRATDQALAEPVLMLETDTGAENPTPAGRLITTLGSNRPRLLFLSACQTAKSGPLAAQTAGQAAGQDALVAQSLATALVQAGMPATLGWQGSVGDTAASTFAHHLYARLVLRDPLEVAVAQARLALASGVSIEASPYRDAEDGRGGAVLPPLPRNAEPQAEWLQRDWHLARLWLGGEGGGPMVAGSRKRPRAEGQHGHKELLDRKKQDTQVASAESFVGRRRELQRCVAALRGDTCAGVLIHGLGRQGKSSLAARIANRLKHMTLVVIFGDYRAEAVLHEVLEKVRSKATLKSVLEDGLRRMAAVPDEVGKGEVLESTLYALWEAWAQTGLGPLLLLVDDAERLLDTGRTASGGRLAVQSGHRPLLRALLQAFDPQETPSRLLITSRFPFVLPADGARPRDLVDERLQLEHLRPMTAVGQGKLLRRQLAQQPPTDEAAADRLALLQRVPGLSLGNPGLQDLLGARLVLASQVAPAQAAATLDRVQEVLAGQASDADQEELRTFVSNLALTSLLDLAGSTGRELARLLTPFTLPIPEEVAMLLGPLAGLASSEDVPPQLQRLLELGLVDALEDPYEDTRVGVALAPLLRPLLPALQTAEQEAAVTATLGTLFECWGGAKGPQKRSYAVDILLTQLAVQVSDSRVLHACAGHAVAGLSAEHGPLVAAELGQAALARLEAARGELPWGLVAETANAWMTGGHGDAADVVLAKREPGPADDAAETDDASLSRYWLVQGRRQQQAGKLEAAQNAFQSLLDLAEKRGKEGHAAVALGHMADILHARGELDEALRIRQEEELPVYRRLGDVRSMAVTQGKVADILHARGELDEALALLRKEALPAFERLGDVREMAVTQGKVADILHARGELDEALRIRQELQLPVYRRLGDVREMAVAQGKVADILQVRGELEDARKHHEEALGILRSLGDSREVAARLWLLAQLHMTAGRQEEAIPMLVESFQLFDQMDVARGIAVVGATLGQIMHAGRDHEQAHYVLQRSSTACRKIGRPDRAEPLEALLATLPKPPTES